MTGIELNKLSEPSQFLINDISDHVCCCYRGVPAGTSLSSHAQNSSDSGVLTVHFLGRTLPEQREEVEIPRTDFHVITNTDFVNAATQPKLPLARQPLHRRGGAHQAPYKDS